MITIQQSMLAKEIPPNNQIERRSTAQRLLLRNMRILDSRQEIDSLLGTILFAISSLLDGCSAVLWLIDENLSESDSLPLKETSFGKQTGQTNSVSGTFWQPGDAAMLVDFLGKDRFAKQSSLSNLRIGQERLPQLEEFGICGIVALAARFDDVDYGVLGVWRSHDRILSTEDEELAQALAYQAAIAIKTNQLRPLPNRARFVEQSLSRVHDAGAPPQASLERLVGEHGLDEFLARALRSQVEALGGFAGAYWRNEGQTIVLVLELRNGEIVMPNQTNHPLASRKATKSACFNTEYEKRLLTGECVVFRVEQDYGFDPETQNYLLNDGVDTLIVVPLNIGGRHLGRFSIRVAHQRELTTRELDLIETVAAQSAIAIELTRLANETNIVSLAREREHAANSRADGLARANICIRASLDQLAERQDLKAFLGETVSRCASELGAGAAGIWIRHTEKAHEFLMSSHDGIVEQSAPVPNEVTMGSFEEMNLPLIRGEIVIDSLETLRGREWYSGLAGYLKDQKISAIASFPMFIGDRWAGALVLCHKGIPDYSSEKIELLKALGNQVSLAIELSRLAEVARQSAVAQERALAAMEKVSELSRANESMREFLDQISDSTDLEELPPRVLGALTKLLGADGASMWRYNAEYDPASFEYIECKFPAGAPSNLHNGNGIFFKPTHAASYLKHAQLVFGETHVLDVGTSELFVEDERASLLRQGVQTLIVLPIEAAGRQLGGIALSFTYKRELTSTEFQLAKALANQAGLIIETTRLAAVAKDSAVLRERELAALARAEELDRANQSMARIIEMQAVAPDVDRVLAHALEVLCRTLAGTGGSGALWMLDDDRESYTLRFVYQNGWAIDAKDSLHPDRISKVPITSQPWTLRFQSSGVYPILAGEGLREEHLEYFKSIDAGAILTVPITIAGEAVGCFTLRLPSNHVPSKNQLRFSETIAQQATLALQAHRLSERARTAALFAERNRIAGDIHDSLAQAFIGIVTQLEAVEAHMEMGADNIALNRLTMVKESARFGLSEARRSVFAMRPAELENADLNLALQRLVERTNRIGKTNCQFHIVGHPVAMAMQYQEAFLRIAQEGLANAIKYSEAKQIGVTLQYGEDVLCLLIADDGKGMDHLEAMSAPGMGLKNMEYRMKELAGSLEIHSSLGSGTRLVACLPLIPAEGKK